MSVRDRLAGKTAAREAVSIPVGDHAQAARDLQAAETRLLAARADSRAGSDDASKAVRDAQAAYEAARAAFQDCFVEIWFTRMDPVQFEALLERHVTPTNDLDRERLRPALAAACAEDPDLQDADWWAGQLAEGTTTWSKGERDSLYATLWSLNYVVPRSGLGKG